MLNEGLCRHCLLRAFNAADFGQTTLYLRWLDRHERQPGEEPPIGLILCAGKADERIELLELESTGIRVAQYLTGAAAQGDPGAAIPPGDRCGPHSPCNADSILIPRFTGAFPWTISAAVRDCGPGAHT